MKWKSTIYKVHKKIGLIVFIPVFLWGLSGIMHPFMSNWFRPSIANTRPPALQIDTNAFDLSVRSTLEKNNVESFSDIRLVNIQAKTILQVVQKNENSYFDLTNHSQIENGDKVYAEELARYFLQDSTSKILKMEVLDSFNKHYKYINRLLPVWKVSFDRPDGMVIYVETNSSRLGTFNNQYRRAYISIFSAFHNWSFIPGTLLQHIIVAVFSFLLLIGSITGVIAYIFLWKSRKASKKSSHRNWGISFSLVLMMFSFSGFYHVFVKISPKTTNVPKDTIIQTSSLPINIRSIIGGGAINGMSVCKIGQEAFFQIKKGKKWEYYSMKKGKKIENGDITFATDFVTKIDSTHPIISTEIIQKFGGEYGFINKRLPVIRVNVQSEDNTSYYIETWTGKLATEVNDSDRLEGTSFAIFHKFHFLDGFGKNFRDFIAVLFSLFVMLVAYKGVKGTFKR